MSEKVEEWPEERIEEQKRIIAEAKHVTGQDDE